ncbi:hypothetical protein LTR08_004027 [Meristemomyces frigidus]|nr:hypothetical protein LTR08_004027 [Meristemomyces frigidus]
MSTFQLLHRLPEELLQEILDRLDSDAFRNLNVSSRRCYEWAAPRLWREVTLVDCRTAHNWGTSDEHDDGPLIRKLLVLATKPWLASHVQTLNHRCHLPPPAIFSELPRSTFSSQTLSTDPRTIRLAQLAVQNMTKVTTLRIIFGHPTLNDALLRCFFDKHRRKATPVRRLWLENCRISAGCCLEITDHPYGLPLELDFAGLESVRFRRLPLRPCSLPRDDAAVVYARSYRTRDMQDGRGGLYSTTINEPMVKEQAVGCEQTIWLAEASGQRDVVTGEAHNAESPLERIYECANRWDDYIYDQLAAFTSAEEQRVLDERHVPSHRQRSMLAYRGSLLDPLDMDLLRAWRLNQSERSPSSQVALNVLGNASQTLTSLTLDWIFTRPSTPGLTGVTPNDRLWVDLYLQFLSLRFPHLRAFQLRNAVVPEAALPPGLCLLDHSRITYALEEHDVMREVDLEPEQRRKLDLAGLEFMEAHAQLQCLAWPMDAFFSNRQSPAHTARRVDAVIANLARTLVDLRVDTLYTGVCDPQTEDVHCLTPGSRTRRRRFIQEFASKLTKLESIKIEGDIPRDERREVIRGLHACPLKKIVIIGIMCPLGNTWGADCSDMAVKPNPDEWGEVIEGEDKGAIWQYGPGPLNPPGANFKFQPEYGWPAGPPMIHTIASYHANTVTELKFCGYKGAPVLLTPTPVTTPMLSALKHFHNLESLILSLWLTTTFEGEARDEEVIAYWLNARSPDSTALVLVTDEEPEGWEKELLTNYAPKALAWRITSFIGPFLSERAKAREGGVHVRASFSVGDWGGMFDADLRVGKGAMGSDVCLGFEGPREELESGRRRSKLEGRRWF